MKENSEKWTLKKKDFMKPEEEKRATLFSKYKGDITEKEYNLRIKNCYFFMRSPLSSNIILETRPDSKKRRKKKKKKRTYFHTQFKNEINKLKPIQKKIEKTSYLNLLPRKTWLNCEKIYNRCLKKYVPETVTFENKYNKNLSQENIINKNKFFSLDKDLKSYKRADKLRANYILNKAGRKSLNNFRMTNYNLSFFKNKLVSKNENNFVKCMRTISSNFKNEGINNILEKINTNDHLDSLREFKLGKDKENKKSQKSLKTSLSFKFERKRLSLLNTDLSQIEIAKKAGIDFGFRYKINSFFEYGTNAPNFISRENDNDDTEFVSEKKNLDIKKLNLKDNNTEKLNENQKFNFFCLNNIFRLEEFHIFGLISGQGKEPAKCSRLLKKILINKFSNEKTYILNEILEKNKFNKKIDYILYVLTFNEFEFLKNLFNTLEEELNSMGFDIEETGATLSLIIFIKDKVISVKIGDINTYFVYNIIDDKYNNNLMIRNPNFEHNIKNIFEKYRLEENKCEIKMIKNNIGRKSYLVLNNNDDEIQNYINTYNIKFTRMLGFRKLKKIGIINEPEIHTFSMVLDKEKIEIFPNKKKNKNINPHISDSDFIELIRMKKISFTQVILKFVVLGNDKLFQVMEKSYYIKEINEAMKKDEIANKQKDNIKYSFNLQKTLRKLMNEAVELNKKFFNSNNFKDLSISLVTLVEN